MIGWIIGAALAVAVLGVFFSLVGGGILAALAALMAIPLAFPLSLTAVGVLFLVLWIRHVRGRR